jgi:hypothetical protein
MSCFWTGLLQGYKLTWSITELLTFLYDKAIETKCVTWNGIKPTIQQLQENLEAIQPIKELRVNEGYLCSTFDPVLMLMCELFGGIIEHNYMSNLIIYKNICKDGPHVRFESSSSHFWFVSIV